MLSKMNKRAEIRVEMADASSTHFPQITQCGDDLGSIRMHNMTRTVMVFQLEGSAELQISNI